VLDVGIEVTTTNDVDAIDVALPFQIEERVADLYDRLLDKEIADLIWGEAVTLNIPKVGTASVTFADGTELALGRISETKTLVRNEPERNASICHLQFADVLPSGRRAYYRVRFKVPRPGRTWTWKRSGLGANGALLDFRISDPRETWHSRAERDLRSRIQPIGQAYLFVITSWGLQMRVASPTLRYVRVLEGQGWSSYLDRPTTFWRRARLVVYYWRWPAQEEEFEREIRERVEALEERTRPEQPPSAEARHRNGEPVASVTQPTPARAFLDLSRDPGLLPFGNFVRFGVVAGVVALITTAALGHAFWDHIHIGWGWAPTVAGWIGISSVIALAAFSALVGRVRRWILGQVLVAYRRAFDMWMQLVWRLRARS
jgi:hypothetical protein